ncbi:MAG: hypothetical protein LQ340_004792, partial [Diploschistes diacapsis]
MANGPSTPLYSAHAQQRSPLHQDKTLSDDFDPILALQGMGWLTRKAIGLATVTQSIKHYSSSPSPSSSAGAKGTVHIDTEQTVTGGISASPEYRVLDWQERPHSDRIFGELVGRSRYVDPRALPDAELGADKDWLAGGWDEEGEKVESLVENRAAGWTAVQIWGFAVVEGKRRH